MLAVAGAGWFRVHAQQASFTLPVIDLPRNNKAAVPPATGQTPAQQNPQAAGGSAYDANKPAAVRECADLLKMATDLKTAVDKSTKDELSLTVVRKASDIEQWAHKVRTVGTTKVDAKTEAKATKGP